MNLSIDAGRPPLRVGWDRGRIAIALARALVRITPAEGVRLADRVIDLVESHEGR
ncbi:hypothetical protein ABQF26_01660 [Mycolicibacterium elephantis]